ncbi:DUF6428 family protein [Aurantibacter sp.]|uniref:DUF6428 family protein n=1 Tax=Aurantibacter sp. TaxID=2807103 RepID=UPI0035C86600
MNLQEIKNYLQNLEQIAFVLPNGNLVPEHFHVTEIGKVSKTFIDCGGKLRQEKKINFQLWNATDYNHRLHPEKLVSIINLAEETLNLANLDVEVEFQGKNTIETFGLEFKDEQFHLTGKITDCLALDECGLPNSKPKVKISEIASNSCAPNSGCC